MTTVFSRILAGELPGRFVHTDDVCAAFLTVAPVRPGHTLVVPRAEVDSWLDLDDAVADHLFRVARRVGTAVTGAFRPQRVALLVAGFEVPHVHLHVIPADSMDDLDLARADPDPGAAALDDAQARLRTALAGPDGPRLT